ncbi:cell filamentation protein Fic [bacterium]|nr:cell filamentation protein Fic [bacterium]
MQENSSQIIIYQTESGETKLDVRFENEAVWLTQRQLCELFDKSKATVSEHLKHIFEEELQENMVVRNFRTTTQHGAIIGKTQSRNVKFYNLDALDSLGFTGKKRLV